LENWKNRGLASVLGKVKKGKEKKKKKEKEKRQMREAHLPF